MPTELDRELKIELDKLPDGKFRARISFDDPNSDAVGGFRTTTVELPAGFGTGKTLDPSNDNISPYGQALAAALFQDLDFRDFYIAAKTKSANGVLRLRLFFTANAEELHSIRWELLCDPSTNQLIATDEKILLSRFVSTSQWKTVHLPRKNELRALIAVSNPPDLPNGFKPIDVRGEVVRAWLALSATASPSPAESDFASVPLESLGPTLLSRAGLGGMKDIRILGNTPAEPASRDNLVRELHAGIDILYLVCHGSFVDLPILYLQKDTGGKDMVNGVSLANDFRTIQNPPMLVVLASCESAGSGADGKSAKTAVAPLLADAGVPAIVAMLDQIKMETVRLIMPHFFREIAVHGQIERAMAVARRKAFAQPNPRFDAWMPALFLRLRSGSLWYTPGFGGTDEEDSIGWDAIVTAARNQALVPILGQELAEHIYGTTAELTAKLAEDTNIPRSLAEKPESARILQAVETKLKRETLYEKLNTLSTERLIETARRVSPAPLRTPTSEKPFTETELLDIIVDVLSQDPNDPFTILAGLDVKVYVSAAVDNLLKRFVRKKGKVPYEMCIDWRNEANNGFDRISAAAADLLAAFEANPAAKREELMATWESKVIKQESRKRLLEVLKRSLADAEGPDNTAMPVIDTGAIDTPMTEMPIGIRVSRDMLLDRFADNPPATAEDSLRIVRDWRKALVDRPSDIKGNPWPIETPILYFAYGRKRDPDTLVLTEDDFFEYLIQCPQYNLMPPIVSSSIVLGSLLFLGFSLEDWKFRVLFRTIMNKSGAGLLKRKEYKHVGVQLDPSDYSPAEAVRAKGLLMEYFKASHISIYWGSSADFLRELSRRLAHAPVVNSKPD